MTEKIMLREREGMKVWHDPVEDFVYKEALDVENSMALDSSYRFFRALKDTTHAPRLWSYDAEKWIICMSYVYDEPVQDPEFARRCTVKLLLDLRERHIIHGDSTAPNLHFQADIPRLLDWDQAIFTHQPKPQKRPKPDAAHIWPAVVAKAGDPSRVIRRWLAIREEITYYLGWGNLFDLGCCWLDVGAMALAEGMHVTGVDDCSIHSDCLEVAQKRWSYHNDPHSNRCFLVKADIPNYFIRQGPLWNPDVVLMLSTWPYIAHKHGPDFAKDLLLDIAAASEVFVFETQYFGDGPGIEQVKNHDDVKDLFKGTSYDVYPIVTIPVDGRDAERTTWVIR